ncbi:hypothetical protein ACROYT_G040204 [Oculina patagonica]
MTEEAPAEFQCTTYIDWSTQNNDEAISLRDEIFQKFTCQQMSAPAAVRLQSSSASRTIAPNMQVESSSTPLMTIDEVEKIQRQKIASFVGHVFQLTYAAIFDGLIHEEKVNRCNGCGIQHPSQRQHSCVMMDNEDAWFYYNDEVREKIDLNLQ